MGDAHILQRQHNANPHGLQERFLGSVNACHGFRRCFASAVDVLFLLLGKKPLQEGILPRQSFHPCNCAQIQPYALHLTHNP